MLGDVGKTTVAVSDADRANGLFARDANSGTGGVGENIYGQRSLLVVCVVCVRVCACV